MVSQLTSMKRQSEIGNNQKLNEIIQKQLELQDVNEAGFRALLSEISRMVFCKQEGQKATCGILERNESVPRHFIDDRNSFRKNS